MSSTPKNILLAFDWYDQRIYKGIVRYASSHDWHISPYLFSDRFIPYGWPGDGAITCYGKTLGKFISSLDMPIVDVSNHRLPREVDRVTVDDEMIGALAAEHFIARGFNHFAYYSWPSVEVNNLRKDSFLAALESRGISSSCIHLIKQPPARILGDWNLHQQAILEQMKHLPRPLAVFAGQDNLGATLIEICIRHGIHIPEEVSVLGVDNLPFLSDCLAVPLSSIDTNLEELGYQAAMKLDDLLNRKKPAKPVHEKIAPKGIIARQSTDILAVDHAPVVRALRFIKENFSNPITLEDIGRHAGMSKRGLEKAFLKHLGRSPAHELRRLRLDHAKRMLTETDEKIHTVAIECGYSNSSNLSFAFNKDTNMSPRAYRNAFRSKSDD